MIDHSNHRHELFDDFKKGDGKALKKYFDRYHRGLYFMVLRIVRREEVVEEIIDDAFVKAWEYRDSIKDEEHLWGFLFIVARNGAIEHFRQMERRQKGADGLSRLEERVYIDPTEHEILEARLLENLHQNIERLPPQGKRILIMRYLMDKEVKIIARFLDLSEQTVRNHLNRSIHFLRKRLSDPGLLLLFITLIFAE